MARGLVFPTHQMVDDIFKACGIAAPANINFDKITITLKPGSPVLIETTFSPVHPEAENAAPTDGT